MRTRQGWSAPYAEPVDPVDWLIADEAVAAGLITPGASVLVMDAPELAQWARDEGCRVTTFDDLAQPTGPGTSTTEPGLDVQPAPAAALLRLPTSLDALDEYARWVAATGCPHLVAGGRVKHLSPGMNDVLARWFTGVRASLGRQKSRVLHATAPRERPAATPPWPRTNRVTTPAGDLVLAAHGGTFAGCRLDAGTRLLLTHWDAIARACARRRQPHLVDWGSGNGVLATLLARTNPAATVTALDRSWAAAQATAETARLNGAAVDSRWADGVEWLRQRREHSVDVVVTNPPFHVGAAKESSATLDMIDELARVLAPGGEVWCVFNSHLPWLAAFRQSSPATRVVGRNRHYTVVWSRRA